MGAMERRARKYLWVPEGTYRHCVIWYTLWQSARLTRREAREEMKNRHRMHDFDSYRIVKFERRG